MQFTIHHETTYRYPQKVQESYTVVHLQPRSDENQYCTKFELIVTPQARVFSYGDRFGNDVQHFAVLPPHDVLSIVARSNVVTTRRAGETAKVDIDELRRDPALDAFYDYLRPSPYVDLGPALRAFAQDVPDVGDDAAQWYRGAGHAIRTTFAYDRDATTVHTTVDESVRRRAGVCQDFAHVLIALCRYRGIPARYASGYIMSDRDGVIGAEASHAWCEAYLPPLGWVGFDPTNDIPIDERFVKISVGRDYLDVSPVRGVYKGPTAGTMSVNVAMDAIVSQQ